MGVIDIYWLPHCSTCKKAVAYLKANACQTGTYRDLKSEPLSRREVEGLAKLAGGPESIFSKKARKYRSMRLNERVLSDKDMLDLMTDEYTFIKRPVIVFNGKAISGFSDKSYEIFLNE